MRRRRVARTLGKGQDLAPVENRPRARIAAARRRAAPQAGSKLQLKQASRRRRNDQESAPQWRRARPKPRHPRRRDVTNLDFVVLMLRNTTSQRFLAPLLLLLIALDRLCLAFFGHFLREFILKLLFASQTNRHDPSVVAFARPRRASPSRYSLPSRVRLARSLDHRPRRAPWPPLESSSPSSRATFRAREACSGRTAPRRRHR